MKKLANLKGVKALTRSQQKEIFGGELYMDLDGGAGGGCYARCVGWQDQFLVSDCGEAADAACAALGTVMAICTC